MSASVSPVRANPHIIARFEPASSRKGIHRRGDVVDWNPKGGMGNAYRCANSRDAMRVAPESCCAVRLKDA
jgi:hypothetical protein